MKQIVLLTYRTFTRIFRTRDIKFSLISIFLIIIIATILLTINIIGKTYEYNIGDIANEEIRIPRDIYYINESETVKSQKSLAEAVPLVFDKDDSILNDNIVMVNSLFNHIEMTLKNFPPIGVDDVPFYILVLKSKLPPYQQYNDEILGEILSSGKTVSIKRTVTQVLLNLYDEQGIGILDTAYKNPLNLKNSKIVIRTINSSTTDTDPEVSGNLDNLRVLEDVRVAIPKTVYANAGRLQAKTINAVSGLVQWHLKPNMKFNSVETKRRIEDTLKNIRPTMSTLKKGMTIVREGDTITQEIKFRLDIFNKNAQSAHVSYIIGIFLIQLIFIFIFGFFLLEYSRVLIPDRKSTMIIFTLVMFLMIYGFFVSRSEQIMDAKLTFALLLPIPFVTMIISILYNLYLAMMVGIYAVFFAAVISGGDLSTITISFSAAILGVFVNANVNKRTDFLRGGLVLGFINTAVVIAVALMQEIPMIRAVNTIPIAFASGFINSILVLGILPLYENVFGITTKFKLLELSDLNAEIFKQMLVEAPGTYNHSLIVSTMAEAATKDINANYMLARVGAFYHDIGKIADASMYIENRVTDPRAKSMTPLEYSKLIISHVEKGVEMAREHLLPETVIDFIREHHGQTTMTYFYHQALAEIDGSDRNATIDKRDFQYPGPKPHSKETAVVMLADSIEAASRSLQEPTREKLQGLVRKIIYNKLNDGELEISELSMTELNTIQNSFLKILNGIFHTRIEYPERKDVEKLEKKVKTQW